MSFAGVVDMSYTIFPSLFFFVWASQARPDGLYSYSKSERTGVAPIDGNKLAMCIIPPSVRGDKRRDVTDVEDDIGIGSGYVLVASTDTKSNRDTVDIYDITNNLVAFHLLLSPGHRAVRAAATVTTQPSSTVNVNRISGSSRTGSNGGGGQSSAVVLTSGGSLVTCTEKRTDEKISLLIQKNLYSAAIVVAYADPSYDASEITALYQNYAEHLYQKGDFAGAIDQYIQTIGSLESSHVIFRYLDAPKIPLLVKYLEQLRTLSLATPMHNDLLRTCYLKLNDTEAAEAISITTASSPSSLTTTTTNGNNVSIAMASVLSNLTLNPKEALATVCSLEAIQAAEIMMIHGASLARAFPRETAGVILSLCLGTFSPKALSDVSIVNNPTALYKLLQYNGNTPTIGDQQMTCEPYPAHIFLPRTFVEHPKMLRLVLAHCNRNKCPLTPELRRTLLELTLSEWNRAKRSGDTESEKLRHKEAIAVSFYFDDTP
jgi:vacuolar protein sorting-associated protein 11